MSAEFTLKTVKLASCHYLDDLPTTGNELGRAFRDRDLEEKIYKLCADTGIGAQFGGKYFAHDVRVIRLPRHGASCPVGLGVSCSAHRQILGKITRDGVFLEQLETNPAQYLPDIRDDQLSGTVVSIDLNRPMAEILAELRKHPVATRLSLTGPMIVARDIAHAKLKERLDTGDDLPQYFKDHVVYYAGPAKQPKVCLQDRSAPPRRDVWIPTSTCSRAMAAAWSCWPRAIARHRCGRRASAMGFYLGSIGGPAARLAEHSIKKVEVLEYPELGMEAIWRIEWRIFQPLLW